MIVLNTSLRLYLKKGKKSKEWQDIGGDDYPLTVALALFIDCALYLKIRQSCSLLCAKRELREDHRASQPQFKSLSYPLSRPPLLILTLQKHKCLLIAHLRISKPNLHSSSHQIGSFSFPLQDTFYAFVLRSLILPLWWWNWGDTVCPNSELAVWAGLKHTCSQLTGCRLRTDLFSTLGSDWWRCNLSRIFCLPLFVFISLFYTTLLCVCSMCAHFRRTWWTLKCAYVLWLDLECLHCTCPHIAILLQICTRLHFYFVSCAHLFFTLSTSRQTL